MFLDLLFYIFVVVSSINILHFGFYLVGANVYDIARFRSGKASRSNALKQRKILKRFKKNPLVSVLIPAHNEELSIIRCLESVASNSYKKIEIFVIDDASKDATKSLVRKYIDQHPDKNIVLKYKLKNSGKAEALNHALRNSVSGELVMTLDADSVLEKNSIKNAVAYFKDPSIVGVAANVRVLDSKTILGLLQKFEYLIAYRSKKFYSSTNCELIIGGVASTYRTAKLREVGFYDNDSVTEDIALSMKIAARGNKENRLIYGFNVLVMTEGVQTFKALIKQRYRWKMGNLQSLLKYHKLFIQNRHNFSRSLLWYRLPMAYLGEILLVLEMFSLGFVIYVCSQLMSLSLIAGAYLTITMYLLWTIFPDEHMNLRKKISMSTYAPVMYFIFYLMNVVQIVALAKCIANYKQVARKVAISTTWVSPVRSGDQQVKFS